MDGPGVAETLPLTTELFIKHSSPQQEEQDVPEVLEKSHKRKGKGDILMKWELQTAKRDRQTVEDAHSEYTCELPALSILRALGNASLPPLVTSSVPLQILVDLRCSMLKPTWPSESPWRQISMWHLKSASPLHYLRWVSVVTVSHNEQWRLMLCIQFSTCSNNIPKGSLNFNDVRRSQPHHGSS